jgi:hypothetical protein
MTIELLDRSNYLRGLLILIRSDKVITESEKRMVLNCGASLGFERRFCETAINELLENEYILDTPPVFSNSELAECFLRDAIRVALADKTMHLFELQWLIDFAQSNGLPLERVDELIKFYITNNAAMIDSEEFEIKKHLAESP